MDTIPTAEPRPSSWAEVPIAGALIAQVERHRAVLALGLLLVVTAALYAPMLRQWFFTDDFMFVNAAQDAHDVRYIGDAFDFRGAPPFPEGRFYRPLHSSAFVVLYDVFGLNASLYHAWSLALHLASTVFVWLICMRLTKNALASGIAAALFAVHPAHASAVSWISNNNALMATCAALASFLCFMNATRTQRSWYWYGASVVLFCASLLFHPEAGSLIGALIGYRLFIQNESWRQAIEWRRWLDLVPFALAAAAYAAIQSWMAHQGYLPQAESYRVTFHAVRIFLGYLGASVYPVPTDQQALASASSFVAAVAFTVAIVGLLVARRGERPNVAAFALLWFAVALVPLSMIRFEVVWARKLYVAGPALAIILALMITPVLERFVVRPDMRPAASAIVLLVAFGFSLAAWLTVERQGEQVAGSEQSHDYVVQLREAYPEIASGSTLRLVGLPRHLAILSHFYDDYVTNLVGMYYEDVEVVVVHGEETPPAQPGDLEFRYRAQPTGTSAP